MAAAVNAGSWACSTMAACARRRRAWAATSVGTGRPSPSAIRPSTRPASVWPTVCWHRLSKVAGRVPIADSNRPAIGCRYSPRGSRHPIVASCCGARASRTSMPGWRSLGSLPRYAGLDPPAAGWSPLPHVRGVVMAARRESRDSELAELVQAVIDGAASLTQEQRAALANALDSGASAPVRPRVEQDEPQASDRRPDPPNVSTSRGKQPPTSRAPAPTRADQPSPASDQPPQPQLPAAGRVRRKRPVPPIEVTVEVETVSGPGAESLARTQYEAIMEVLQWVHDNRPDLKPPATT